MKTKLGISVTMLAAATYFLGFFSGYVVLALIAGYILLCETDENLKKSAVRAVVISLAFSLISAVIGFIPNLINVIDDLLRIFDESFSIEVISNIIIFINTVLGLLEKVIMLGLGLLALLNKTVKIPGLDDLIEKNM